MPSPKTDFEKNGKHNPMNNLMTWGHKNEQRKTPGVVAFQQYNGWHWVVPHLGSLPSKAKMSVDVKLSSCQAVKAVCQGVWRRQDKTSPVPGVNNAYPSL